MQIAREQYSSARKLIFGTDDKDFSGGLNENENKAINQASDLMNVFVDDGGSLRIMPNVHDVKDVNKVYKRAFNYTNRIADEYAAITDFETVQITKDLKTFTDVPDDVTPENPLTLNSSYETRFTTINGELVGTNGYDDVWRYDGAATVKETAAPKGKFINTYGDRIWIFNDDNNEDGAYYSSIGLSGAATADRFPPVNVLKVRTKKSGQITGAANCKHGQIIFKADATFLLTGYSEKDFELIQISDHVGTVNADSIQEYNGFIIFLGLDGFYITDGTQIYPLPKNTPETIKEITQVWFWKQYEVKIQDTEWPGKEASSSDVFIPDATRNEYFIGYSLHPHIKNNLQIPNGDFSNQFTNWYKTSLNGCEWTSGSSHANCYLPGVPVTTHVGNGKFVASKIHWEIYNEDKNETVKSGDVTFTTWGGYSNNNDTISVDLSTADIKHNGCRCSWRITIYGFKVIGFPTNGGEPAQQGGIVQGGYLQSDPFFLTYPQIGSYFAAFHYERQLTWTATSTSIGTGTNGTYYEVILLASSVKVGVFYGKGNFGQFEWISEEIPVSQKQWGAFEVSENEWDSAWNKTYQMQFYNGTSWSAWIDVTNGVVPADPYISGVTTKVKFRVYAEPDGAPGTMVDWPMRVNYIKIDYFYAQSNIPKSIHSISSAIYDRRYIMAYTKAGDELNKYVVVIDNLDEKIGYRYFKWKITGAACFLGFLHNVYCLTTIGNNAWTAFQLLNDKYGSVPNNCAFYDTAEIFGEDGLMKNFKKITCLRNKNDATAYDLNMKVEVWIDGQYAGDLDLWAFYDNEFKYSNFTYLLQFEYYAQIYPYGTFSIITKGYIPREFYQAGFTQAVWNAAKELKKVPIGFGNKIKFRFIWLHPTGGQLANTQRVRGIQVEYDVREEDLLNDSGIIRGGNLY